MPHERSNILAFNRGIMSKLGLSRIDLNRYGLSAEVMTNWMARVLGSMMLRPGLEYKGNTRSNAKSKSLPFIFSFDDMARVEITSGFLRVWVNDVLVTRPAVTSTITNGTFNTDIVGWTDDDEAAATSVWVAGGYMSLVGSGANAARRTQQITVAGANIGVQHALRIVINRGPVTLRVGSTSGADDYIAETVLKTGTHSITLTPTGNFFIQVLNRRLAASLVDSITMEASGAMEVPVPWLEADLPYLRIKQSGDVIFVACRNYQQRRIERRDGGSWSVVLYEPENGPFRVLNTSEITITPSAITGDITLTASKALFKATQVGALFRLTSVGQQVSATLTGANQFTSEIRVTGIGAGRAFSITITGVFVATLTLQYSVSAPGAWVDATTYAGPIATSYNDGFDNQIIYYRIGIKGGNYTSGTAVAALFFTAGSVTGIARITGFTSDTVVNAAVLKDLGGTTATTDWSEGRWSQYRGWPSSVALHEGRMTWAGKDRFDFSESDNYESFDDTIEGDSASISRSIGEGPVDTINWLLSLGRLLMGTAENSANIAPGIINGNSVLNARSSSLDEPLTLTNFNLKRTISSGVFVDRSGQRLYEIAYDPNSYDYTTSDLSLVAPDLNAVGISGIAIQMKPDVRIHCYRTDGTAGVLIFDRSENVTCWLEVETDGEIEDVLVLPAAGEDQVTYTVKRAINGATVRFHERWALESQCTGLPIAKHADAFYSYSGIATTTITGLSHLEGETVVVWGWNTTTPFTVTLPDGTVQTVGRDFGTFVVTGGQITGLSAAVTNATVGLGYTARWKSMKLALSTNLGTPLNQTKRVNELGVVLQNTHNGALSYGPTFDLLDDMPQVIDDFTLDANTVWSDYDKPTFTFAGEWDTDARICLQASAPKPCTLLSIVFGAVTNG